MLLISRKGVSVHKVTIARVPCRNSGQRIYFAHSDVAWKRDLNENASGLIRQYFPKGSAFTALMPANIETVMERLNHRPCKTLDFATPYKVFCISLQRL